MTLTWGKTYAMIATVYEIYLQNKIKIKGKIMNLQTYSNRLKMFVSILTPIKRKKYFPHSVSDKKIVLRSTGPQLTQHPKVTRN